MTSRRYLTICQPLPRFCLPFAYFLAALTIFSPQVQANDGEPIAVRQWDGQSLTLETHWGLILGVACDAEFDNGQLTGRTPDAAINVSESYDHSLTRDANMDEVSWVPATPKADDPNALHVQTASSNVQIVSVDGLTVCICNLNGLLGARQTLREFLKSNYPDRNLDVLAVAGSEGASLTELRTLVRDLVPRYLLPINANEETLAAWQATFGIEPMQYQHNTLAVAKQAAEAKRSMPKLIALTSQPWEMPTELSSLFTAMEKSCSDSQEVFAKLSTEQMNFKPSNGTHTPRWNTEHMMGRQLGFFSQIYHELNPEIPVMNLNPKQMPPEYEFAHPDWTGKEEARQMQRVSEFTRRFAYLLEDVEFDVKAPGSFWTLRALLKQMDRHYSEHTANTIKKFELPDWPKE